MGRIVNYRDLEAWQSAMKLLLVIYDIASRLPHVERFELPHRCGEQRFRFRRM
jgi:hypothetical protein